MNRGALDPLKDCRAAIRRSSKASNACLKAYLAAFRDECPRACMADSLEPSIPSCDGACRVGYEAGVRQSRRLFFKDEEKPAKPPSSETVAIGYGGYERVIAKYEGQTWHQAAAVWCRGNDGESAACPRILLMLLEQKGYL